MWEIVRLIRPNQWYKNALVFLALIFALRLNDLNAVTTEVLAFFSLCALSSATYIMNDIVDYRVDRWHPEKRSRPLASGRISFLAALGVVVLLAIMGFGLSLLLPLQFLYAALGMFALSQLYTIWLKREPFADILAVAVNFVLRAVAGAFAIDVRVSPWLIAGVFFLALFLLVGKRKADAHFLGAAATWHRNTLSAYPPEVTNRLMAVTTSSLILSYASYVFFGEHHGLAITLPVALYAIFRYQQLIENSPIGRHPEKVFFDRRMLVAMGLWSVLTLFALYA
jgi:4-hydroxybenzoate polyprenyltransferase